MNEQTVERVLTVRENHWEKITYVLKQSIVNHHQLLALVSKMILMKAAPILLILIILLIQVKPQLVVAEVHLSSFLEDLSDCKVLENDETHFKF